MCLSSESTSLFFFSKSSKFLERFLFAFLRISCMSSPPPTTEPPDFRGGGAFFLLLLSLPFLPCVPLVVRCVLGDLVGSDGGTGAAVGTGGRGTAAAGGGPPGRYCGMEEVGSGGGAPLLGGGEMGEGLRGLFGE